MIKEYEEIVEELFDIFKEYIWNSRGSIRVSRLTKAEKYIFYSVFKMDKRQSPGTPSRNFIDIVESVITGDINKIIRKTEKLKEKFSDEVSEKIEGLIADAWDRITEGAREDMFDELQMQSDDDEVEWNGNTYSDASDIDTHDMFEYYESERGAGFFADWFRQEFSHNLQQNDLIKEYDVEKMIEWDDFLQGGYSEMDLDYNVQRSTSEELQQQADLITDDIVNIFKRMKKEIYLSGNKQLMFDMIFEDRNRISREEWQKVVS